MVTALLKFRFRLTLIFTIIIGCAVLAAGIYMSRTLESASVQNVENNLISEIHMADKLTTWRRAMQASPPEQTELQQLAQRIHQSTNARITFVDTDGRVIADSDVQNTEGTSIASKAEMLAAKHSGAGYAVRGDDVSGQKMIYAAVKETSSNGTIGYIRMAVSVMHIHASQHHLWILLITALILLFLLAVIISFRVAHGLTRPLEQIAQVADRIKNMQYHARVTVQGNNEISRLGNAINTMAQSLETQVKQLQENENRLKSVLDNMVSGVMMINDQGEFVLINRSAETILGFSMKELLGVSYKNARQHAEFTATIEECLDRRMRIREEIIFYFPEERILEVNLIPVFQQEKVWDGILIVLHDITAIRRLEKMRSEFVANVSHELKTPVASVQGFAETLLAGALEDRETARSFVQIIMDESQRLNRLIMDILDLSKIESKRIPMNYSPIHLADMVNDCLEMVRSSADKKQIQVSASVDPDIFLEADEDRLKQILMNLLSNGISYTPDEGKVMVTAEEIKAEEEAEAERVRITVADTGIGIPKKDLPRIFERFYRVDKARSRISGGTGLGLSIVKHLVEMHQGTILVDSTIGIGTKFIIELPILH